MFQKLNMSTEKNEFGKEMDTVEKNVINEEIGQLSSEDIPPPCKEIKVCILYFKFIDKISKFNHIFCYRHYQEVF